MSRALPLMLAAVITTGSAGAALLPAGSSARTDPGPAGVTALAVTPIRELAAPDWTQADLRAARAAADRLVAGRAARAAAAAAADAAAARDRQARASRLAEAERASRSRRAVVSYGSPRAIARAQLEQRGWADQFGCLDSLWQKESGWSTYASNASGAYGIPQALPGSKMASAGADWRTNPATQITWGLGYIAGRYGSPCAAWNHAAAYNWY